MHVEVTPDNTLDKRSKIQGCDLLSWRILITKSSKTGLLYLTTISLRKALASGISEEPVSTSTPQKTENHGFLEGAGFPNIRYRSR